MRLTWSHYGGLLRYVDKTGVPAPAFSCISNARCQRCSGAHFESTLVRATSVASVSSQWAFRHMLPPQTPLWRSCVISCHTPCSRSRSSAPIRAHIWRRTPCTACLQNTPCRPCLQNTPCRRLPPPRLRNLPCGTHSSRSSPSKAASSGGRCALWLLAVCLLRVSVRGWSEVSYGSFFCLCLSRGLPSAPPASFAGGASRLWPEGRSAISSRLASSFSTCAHKGPNNTLCLRRSARNRR